MQSLTPNASEVAMRLYELDTEGHGQRWIDLDSITQVAFTPAGNPNPPPPPTLTLTIGSASISVLSTKNIAEIIFILGLRTLQAPA